MRGFRVVHFISLFSARTGRPSSHTVYVTGHPSSHKNRLDVAFFACINKIDILFTLISQSINAKCSTLQLLTRISLTTLQEENFHWSLKFAFLLMANPLNLNSAYSYIFSNLSMIIFSKLKAYIIEIQKNQNLLILNSVNLTNLRQVTVNQFIL